jgi:hypothetical protein
MEKFLMCYALCLAGPRSGLKVKRTGKGEGSPNKQGNLDSREGGNAVKYEKD